MGREQNTKITLVVFILIPEYKNFVFSTFAFKNIKISPNSAPPKKKIKNNNNTQTHIFDHHFPVVWRTSQ